MAMRPPQGTDRLAYVEANHGRWIVRCPYCLGAQVAHRTDHRYLCADCLNGGTARWAAVTWPADAELAERVLEVRPAEAASWNPWPPRPGIPGASGETLAMLVGENARMGYPVPAELTAMVPAAPAPALELPGDPARTLRGQMGGQG
jgi:hypothetical protein